VRQDNIHFKKYLSLQFMRFLRQFLLLGPNNLKEGGKNSGQRESKDPCSNKQWEDEGPESKVVAVSLTFGNKTGS
jgi:hypothetical protein